MSKEEPLVTIISLIYNTGSYVVQALESVRSQSYKNIQHILIDDCSTDDSVEQVESWIHDNKYDCLLVKHERNCGVCISLNDALSRAEGDYIGFVSDDLIKPDKIKLQVDLFRSLGKEYGVVYADAEIINEDNVIVDNSFYEKYMPGKVPPFGDLIESFIQSNPVNILTSLTKREVFNKVGIFDQDLLFEDWDMNFRIARVYKFWYHKDKVAQYRMFSNQMTIVYWNDPAKYLSVLQTNYKMYLKHLDLPKEYTSKITIQLKDLHFKMQSNPFFVKKDNIRISRELLIIAPSVKYFLLLVVSYFIPPIVYFRIREKMRMISVKK